MHVYPIQLQQQLKIKKLADKTGRTFDLIGWVHLSTGDVQPLTIPDTLAPGEPVTVVDGGPLAPHGWGA